jgi:hypothetical protein
VFKEHGFKARVAQNELHLSVDLEKSGTKMDWACYRILDDSIYQWPVVRIPASLHTDLKEISFLRERFFVPNPPEVYLGLKYGREWMIPRRAGSFEREVLDLMAETTLPTTSDSILLLADELEPQRHTDRLKVLDFEGRPRFRGGPGLVGRYDRLDPRWTRRCPSGRPPSACLRPSAVAHFPWWGEFRIDRKGSW